MDQVLQLTIPSSTEHIAIVRLVVSSLALSRREVSDQRIDDLKLAVSEACTNAIEANQASFPGAPVTVSVFEGDDRIEVCISDQGHGFDAGALPSHPPVTDPKRLNFERGLGIPLIKTLVDDAEFESGPGGTTVRMTVFGGPAEWDVEDAPV